MSISIRYATTTPGKPSQNFPKPWIGWESREWKFSSAEDEIFYDEVGNPLGALVPKRMFGIFLRKTFWE